MCRRPLCQKYFRVAEILGHRISNFAGSIQMARPRTPTSILEGRGVFVNHPERRAQRANEPVPSAELGNAPKHFGKDEKRIWKELVQIALPGVLSNSDRWIAETLCILMARQPGNDKSASGTRSPFLNSFQFRLADPYSSNRESAAPGRHRSYLPVHPYT